MECSHAGEGGCRDPSALTWHAVHEKQLPGISDVVEEDPSPEQQEGDQLCDCWGRAPNTPLLPTAHLWSLTTPSQTQEHRVGAISTANCTLTQSSVLQDIPTCPPPAASWGFWCQQGSHEPVHSKPSRQWPAGCHETAPSLRQTTTSAIIKDNYSKAPCSCSSALKLPAWACRQQGCFSS